MTSRALIGLLLLASPQLVLPGRPPERVSFHAADGTRLAALLYQPAAASAPGIVLVHMLRRSGADWTAAAERLRDAGFVVLAPDLRGHGDSAGTTDPGELLPLVQDVSAAIAFLKHRPGVAADRLGAAGASIGANLALVAAAGDPAVRSLVLLSAGLDYRGVKCEAAMKKYGDRPVLLVAGSNDPYALRSARALGEIAARAQIETRDAAGHGTLMFAHAPDLIGRLVDWFQATLL